MQTPWQQFFSTFGQAQPLVPEAENYISPLSHYSLIRSHGSDSGKFIQGQSSCNINEVSQDQAQYGSFSNPKGRAFSNFLIAQTADDDYLLRLDSSINELTQQSLAKYLAFFKAEQETASHYLIFGLKGEQAKLNLASLFSNIPKQALGSTQQNGNYLLCINPEQNLFECWLNAEHIEQSAPLLLAQLPILEPEQWQLAMIQQGLADITAATTDLFIPQMLNYQATGGISFTKGCFTGQEIIARMQYKGKVKRRLYRMELTGSANLKAGDELFIEGKSQAIGNIVNCCTIKPDQHQALAVITEEASQQTQLFLADGASFAINLLELPYSIDDNKK